MIRFIFRIGDIVKATGDPSKQPVIGRVVSQSVGSGHQWYRIIRRADTYNCRDDELELWQRKGPDVIGETMLFWHSPEEKPAVGVDCMVLIRDIPEAIWRLRVDENGALVVPGRAEVFRFPWEDILAWAEYRPAELREVEDRGAGTEAAAKGKERT